MGCVLEDFSDAFVNSLGLCREAECTSSFIVCDGYYLVSVCWIIFPLGYPCIIVVLVYGGEYQMM